MRLSPPGLGGAPEGRRRLESISPEWTKGVPGQGYPPSEFAATPKYAVLGSSTPETFPCELLAQLQASDTRNSRLTSTGRAGNTRIVYQRAGKGGKQIERRIISTFQIASRAWFQRRALTLG
jgi:hypothetical protein